ncbi:MAG TPA: crossover junction endodeoxyribonuclease RuvC [Anaerolineae bacterium]|nr:crossover junction endodeoxyribonuclease RuvC [Anaerolineae bacterium]
MLVLGIDPGTAITGYGLIEELNNKQLKLITCGTIRTVADLAHEKRLLVLYREIRNLLLLHKPDCAAVEELFFQTNVRTALSVGQARGAILLALAQAGVPVSEYNPLEVKQAVTGYGAADKNQVQSMVKVLLGMPEVPRPDDVADSLAVAICHIHSYKMRNLE